MSGSGNNRPTASRVPEATATVGSLHGRRFDRRPAIGGGAARRSGAGRGTAARLPATGLGKQCPRRKTDFFFFCVHGGRPSARDIALIFACMYFKGQTQVAGLRPGLRAENVSAPHIRRWDPATTLIRTPAAPLSLRLCGAPSETAEMRRGPPKGGPPAFFAVWDDAQHQVLRKRRAGGPNIRWQLGALIGQPGVSAPATAARTSDFSR